MYWGDWGLTKSNDPTFVFTRNPIPANSKAKDWIGIMQAYREQLGLSSSIFEPATKYDLLDVVAITDGAYNIPIGQVGTIVHIFEDNTIYEVEFCDDDGRTLYQGAIEEGHLIKLKFN